MYCHDLVANHSVPEAVPRTMWGGGGSEYRHNVRGPAVIVNAPDATIFRTAIIAAAIWNQYLPQAQPKMFNISTASLPGSVVGQIWIPCPNDVCNVTIDPSYGSPMNVIIHEIGHGLGIPEGSQSGIGSYIDGGNHWVPESVDPREIMTETLHERPYIAMYTLRAMGGEVGHRGCRETYECPQGLVCYPTSVYDGPGVCGDKGGGS